ncbi:MULTISPECIES: hypothetical protein [Idiomarina]|jgi:hypothetical protein|uniref:hypothetical protein n=1 Tax=Idiomarina TaxID=135575 RepID=UPI000C3B0732|nr:MULTISPECIES: hypothetical protein [Idiomarina]MBP59530.1 hypothetical protein [Idiomarina sp.]|tara:strand:- start:4466 stop:5068 length:603 start_codon:yes stop_codon:yes gene_type:complete
MELSTLDIIKLTFPFLIAMLVLWLKNRLERYWDMRSKQKTLSKLLLNEAGDVLAFVGALKRSADSVADGNFTLVSIKMPIMVEYLSKDLASLDNENAHIYGDLISHFQVCEEGLSRLFRFLETRAASKDKNNIDINAALIAQSRATARDYINFSASALSVLEIIPQSISQLSDQATRKIKKDNKGAEQILVTWPENYNRS